jgi:hypothetical protein
MGEDGRTRHALARRQVAAGACGRRMVLRQDFSFMLQALSSQRRRRPEAGARQRPRSATAQAPEHGSYPVQKCTQLGQYDTA